MESFRRQRRSWANLAILALVGKMLLVLLAANTLPDSRTTIVDDVLGVMAICHGAGEAGADSPSGDRNMPSAEHCPWCMLAKVAALAVALAIALVSFPIVTRWRWLALRVRLVADHVSAGAVRSRAPPLPA